MNGCQYELKLTERKDYRFGLWGTVKIERSESQIILKSLRAIKPNDLNRITKIG
jgi:hypothetical protein